ncbi:ABC transporter ATP-binding protein [soil metagenome]
MPARRFGPDFPRFALAPRQSIARDLAARVRTGYRADMDLIIRNLTKTYANGTRALDGVNLDIPTGLFGLLGPNGAGKSSLMRTLATLQQPDEGSAILRGAEGQDIDVLDEQQRVRSLLGYLPQDFGVYPKATALDLLDHLARLKGLSSKRERQDTVRRLLEQTNLWSARKKALGGFSGGMRQRFGIAQALLGNPKLIIVDEPTAGLDPEERVRFHNLLAAIGEQVIVILSTHIVSDVADLCPKLAIMNKGQVLLTGTPQQLEALLTGRVWRKTVARDAVDSLRNEHTVITTRLSAGHMVVHVLADQSPGADFEPTQGTLEDVYFAAIGGHLFPVRSMPAAVAA